MTKKQINKLFFINLSIVNESFNFKKHYLLNNSLWLPVANKTITKTLLSYLNELDYEEYEVNTEVYELANLIIDEGILKPKSMDDATHIAVAILSNANMILSWNFKHLVNYNTINGVRQICFKKHINRIIDICSPYVLLENEENEGGKNNE